MNRRSPRTPRGAMAAMIALSLALHGSLLFASRRLQSEKTIVVASPAPPPEPSSADVWSGESPMPGEVYPIHVDDARAANPIPPAEPPPASPPRSKGPEAEARGRHADPAPTAGESAPMTKLRPAAKPHPDEAGATTAAIDPSAPPTPSAGVRSTRRSEVATTPTRSARPHGTGSGTGGGPFGAEGEPSVRSLGRAFLRAIPPACSGDPAWATVPVGEVGHIEIEIAIDEAGKLKKMSGDDFFRSTASSASAELLSIARRTTKQLEFGTFAVHAGDAAAGTELLRLTVRASNVDVPPDLPGGVFGLEHDYDKGSAGFTTRSGRHIEVRVTVIKAETP